MQSKDFNLLPTHLFVVVVVIDVYQFFFVMKKKIHLPGNDDCHDDNVLENFILLIIQLNHWFFS